MNATTVLLDAGGVLLDEAEMEASRAQATAEYLRGFVPDYTVRRYYEDIEEAVSAHSPNAYIHVFWKHLHRESCQAAYDEFVSDWRPPPLRLMDEIAREVRELAQSFRLGIAGQYGVELNDLLRSEGLLEHFAWRFTQEDFELTKPDPRYLERICAACGVDPKECVMVGDRIDKDVVPARMLGMGTVRVRTGLHRRQESRAPSEVPDVELESVRGLALATAAMWL